MWPRHCPLVQSHALRAIATLVATNASLDDVASLVAESLQDVFVLDQAAVVRFDAPGGGTVMAMKPSLPAFGAALALGRDDSGAAAGVLKTGRPVLVTYTAASTGAAAQAYASGLRVGAAAPIRVGGELWGAIVLASASADALDASVLERLASFGELVEIAIGNAHAWAELTRLATTDGITGLPNRRSFHEQLAREVAQARRRPVAHPSPRRHRSLQAGERHVRPPHRRRCPGGARPTTDRDWARIRPSRSRRRRGVCLAASRD